MTPMQPYASEPRQVATAAPVTAGPAAAARRVAPLRQAAANPRPTATVNNNQQQARRIAPAPQPFFFPFFGR